METDEKTVLKTLRDIITERISKLERPGIFSPIWKDLESIMGYWISDESTIIKSGTYLPDEISKNIFISMEEAKSALAMAQISQLMPYYGGEITHEEWSNPSITKYTIIREGSNLQLFNAFSCYEFVAFRTKEDRDRFMSSKENKELIRDYYMIP